MSPNAPCYSPRPERATPANQISPKHPLKPKLQAPMPPLSSKKPPPYNSSENKDDAGHLLAIDSSVLQPLVRFRRTSLLRTYHETYGREEYDRTSIRVEANRLSLPQRGERVYHDSDEQDNTDIVQELDELAERCRLLSVANSGDPPLRQEAPQACLESDTEEGRKNMLFKLRRPGTPLPSVFLDDSDSEDEAEILPSPSVRRSRLRMEILVPELEDSDGSLSDESEGPATPPAHKKIGFADNGSIKSNTTASDIKPSNSDGCLDGF